MFHADGILAVLTARSPTPCSMRRDFLRQVTEHGPSPCGMARSPYGLHVTYTACRADGSPSPCSMRRDFCRQVTEHGPSPCGMARSPYGLHVTCTARDGSYSVTSWVYKGQDLASLGDLESGSWLRTEFRRIDQESSLYIYGTSVRHCALWGAGHFNL